MLHELFRYQYAALGIDFEGQIGFRKHDSKHNSSGFMFAWELQVCNTKKELLEAFKDNVGFGTITPRDRRQARWAASYQWDMSTEEIRIHLPKIEPYLITKNEQALYLIRVLKIIKLRGESCSLIARTHESPYTSDELEELFYIADQMKELNKKLGSRLEPLTEAEKLLIQLRKR